MSAPTWLAETQAAGVLPGRHLVFVMEHSGGGIIATVEQVREGIVFLSSGLRLRWSSVIGVRDPSALSNVTYRPPPERPAPPPARPSTSHTQRS